MTEIPLDRTVAKQQGGNLPVLFAISFLRGAHQSVYNVVWQPFVLSLGASMPVLGLLNSIGGLNGILSTMMQPVGGWCADRIGGKPFIVVSSIAAAAGYLLFGAAGAVHVWTLILVGIVLYSISALARPAISSMTAESVRSERQGTAFSLIVVATTVPGIVAPALGGWVTEKLGYNATFPLIALLEVIVLWLAWRNLSEPRPSNGEIRWRLAARAMVRSVVPPKPVLGISLAAAGDAFFWGIGWGLLYGMLTETHHFSLEQLGILSSIMSLSWAVLQMPVGRYIDKRGTRETLIFSEAIGIPLMIVWLTQTRFEAFAAAQVLFGLTAATWVPVVNTYLSRVVKADERAEAFGRLNMFRGVVAFPAPAIGGLLYAWGGMPAPITANLIGICIVITILVLFVREPGTQSVAASSATANEGPVK